MEPIQRELSSAGIACADLSLLGHADRGDVLSFTTVGGEPAIRLWRRLRQKVPQTGHWPVLLGPEDAAQWHRERMSSTPSPVAKIHSRAAALDVTRWLAQRDADQLEQTRASNPGEDGANLGPPVGEWPDDVAPSRRFITPFDILTHEPLDRIAVALAPTALPREVPAFLDLGGWNECPDAVAHCALMAYWNRRHGAEILAATDDVIEMEVRTPPRTREAAMALAREQSIYCLDIVEQGYRDALRPGSRTSGRHFVVLLVGLRGVFCRRR